MMSAALVATVDHRGGGGGGSTSNEYEKDYLQRLSHYRMELDDAEEDGTCV